MVTALELARCKVRVAEAMFLEDYGHFRYQEGHK